MAKKNFVCNCLLFILFFAFSQLSESWSTPPNRYNSARLGNHVGKPSDRESYQEKKIGAKALVSLCVSSFLLIGSPCSLNAYSGPIIETSSQRYVDFKCLCCKPRISSMYYSNNTSPSAPIDLRRTLEAPTQAPAEKQPIVNLPSGTSYFDYKVGTGDEVKEGKTVILVV